jgi:hypothetical protein
MSDDLAIARHLAIEESKQPLPNCTWPPDVNLGNSSEHVDASAERAGLLLLYGSDSLDLTP